MKNEEKQVEKSEAVEITWGVKIPVRDGVKLNATLYKPMEMNEPLPVLFAFTPYITDAYHPRGMYFAKNGYVTAVMDIRGRGNSEGEFVPFVCDAEDSHDLIEWFAKQDYCNGQVAMMGGSYGGFDQWAAIKEFPPHLCTIVPLAAAHAGVDMPFFNNIFLNYEMQWLTLVSGRTSNVNLFSDIEFWRSKFRKMYTEHLAFKTLDQLVGNISPNFQMFLSNPCDGEFWDKLSPTVEDYQKIDHPILSVTGHYDGDQPGAMAYYRRHMKYGSEAGKQKHYLVIGPWDHGGTSTPKEELGGLKFGKDSLVDVMNLHKEWYDWVMKDGEKPAFLEKRVAYYVMGAEKWKYADSLETLATGEKVLYLDSRDGQANDIFHSGYLHETRPALSEFDQYVYDPLIIKPEEVDVEFMDDNLTGHYEAMNLMGSGLVYHSEPFVCDTEVSGYVQLKAWIEMDVPDTDFMVMLYEVLADGTTVKLTQDFMRARYRESFREEKLVVPGEINEYLFERFMFFSRQVAKGSRLRLIFKAMNSMSFQKNYNSGGVVAEETGADARTAHVKLLHTEEYPSQLILPIVY